MMDRIFGQAVWSWGKSPEPQEGPKYEQVVKLDTTIKVFYQHGKQEKEKLPFLSLTKYFPRLSFYRLGITVCQLQ